MVGRAEFSEVPNAKDLPAAAKTYGTASTAATAMLRYFVN